MDHFAAGYLLEARSRAWDLCGRLPGSACSQRWGGASTLWFYTLTLRSGLTLAAFAWDLHPLHSPSQDTLVTHLRISLIKWQSYHTILSSSIFVFRWSNLTCLFVSSLPLLYQWFWLQVSSINFFSYRYPCKLQKNYQSQCGLKFLSYHWN